MRLKILIVAMALGCATSLIPGEKLYSRPDTACVQLNQDREECSALATERALDLWPDSQSLRTAAIKDGTIHCMESRGYTFKYRTADEIASEPSCID